MLRRSEQRNPRYTGRQTDDFIDRWRQTDRHADRQGDVLRRYKNRGTPGTQTDTQMTL